MKSLETWDSIPALVDIFEKIFGGRGGGFSSMGGNDPFGFSFGGAGEKGQDIL